MGQRGWQRRLETKLSPNRALGFFRFLLRNLPVLTVEAAEHATGCRQRKRVRAGQEMVQRLLFHRVYVERARICVGQREQRAVIIHTIPAMAAITRLQHAVVGAHLALYVTPELEVMPALLNPTASLPLFPDLALGRIAFEGIRRCLGLAPVLEKIEKRGGAGDSSYTGDHRADGDTPGDAMPGTLRTDLRSEVSTLKFRVHVSVPSRCLIHPHR